MTADVVKDRGPRQGLSQDILRGGRGGGSPCVKQRVHTRLPCRLPSLVVLNVIKKDLKGRSHGLATPPRAVPGKRKATWLWGLQVSL